LAANLFLALIFSILLKYNKMNRDSIYLTPSVGMCKQMPGSLQEKCSNSNRQQLPSNYRRYTIPIGDPVGPFLNSFYIPPLKTPTQTTKMHMDLFISLHFVVVFSN